METKDRVTYGCDLLVQTMAKRGYGHRVWVEPVHGRGTLIIIESREEPGTRVEVACRRGDAGAMFYVVDADGVSVPVAQVERMAELADRLARRTADPRAGDGV